MTEEVPGQQKMIEPKVMYPECEKLSAIRSKSQAIGEFIDWLAGEKNIHLNTFRTTEDLLAECFDIDMNKVEEERRQMLDDFQKMQEGS